MCFSYSQLYISSTTEVGQEINCLLQQEDIRSYIENSLKHGVQLSAFRKERIGGDSHGTYFW